MNSYLREDYDTILMKDYSYIEEERYRNILSEFAKALYPLYEQATRGVLDEPFELEGAL